MTQEAKLQFVIEQLEKKVPFQMMVHHLNDELEILKETDNTVQLVTESELTLLTGKYVYDYVHASGIKSVSGALKQLQAKHHLNIAKQTLQNVYNSFVQRDSNESIVTDDVASKSRLKTRFDTFTGKDTEAIATQANIDEDRTKVSNSAHRDKLRRYSNELVAKQTMQELMQDVVNVIEKLNVQYGKPLENEIKIHGKESADLIAIWSDFHFGEVVRKSTINSINEYNLEIGHGRFKFLVEEIVNKYLQYSNIYTVEKLYLDILGDMFSGDIHEDLKLSNEGRVTTLVVTCAFVVAQGITELLKFIPKIVVCSSYGNHSRLSEKKAFKNHFDNYDYMFVQVISAFFSREIKQGRIEFNLEQGELHLFERRGYNFLLEHGDNFKSIKDIEAQIDKRVVSFTRAGLKIPDYIECGHFHQETEYSNKGIYINGSLKGSDEYVFHQWKAFSQPSQKLMVLTDKGIKETMNIYVPISPSDNYNFNFKDNPVIGKMFGTYI